MGLRSAIAVSVLALLGALAWGWHVDGQPVPARPADLTSPLTDAWQAALPIEADAATSAYLARIPEAMRLRGEAYSDTRLAAFGWRVLTLVLATGLICASGLAAGMRDLAARCTGRPILRDGLFALQYFVALFALCLPAEVYAAFVRQHRFGFSGQPFAAWLGDSLVNWLVFTVFYLAGVVSIYALIRRRSGCWVLGATATYAVLRLLYVAIQPSVIEPLTNDYRPLPDGPQRQQVLAIARASGISDAAVVTGNASAQTRMLNAHVSGFGGAARISIDDNTLAQTSDPMLRAVMAHELGHYVLRHDLVLAVGDCLVAALGFGLISLCLPRLLARFGGRWRIQVLGDIAGLPLFWGLYLLWGFASLPLSNAVSRMCEHQADLYSLGAAAEPEGLAEFMIHDADIARLRPRWYEYALFYDHPSDAERVATAMTWREQMAPLHPRPR